MYYSNGNYEAFARPRKPKNVDQKSAYIIGGGLAGLATAIFLVRDGQMSGEKIHIYEELPNISVMTKGYLLKSFILAYLVSPLSPSSVMIYDTSPIMIPS